MSFSCAPLLVEMHISQDIEHSFHMFTCDLGIPLFWLTCPLANISSILFKCSHVMWVYPHYTFSVDNDMIKDLAHNGNNIGLQLNGFKQNQVSQEAILSPFETRRLPSEWA